MSGTYYEAYTRHCIRIFFRIPRKRVSNDVSLKDWDAAERAYLKLDTFQKSCIDFCFNNKINRNKDLHFLISDFAKRHNTEKKNIEAILAHFYKAVAVERGLA